MSNALCAAFSKASIDTWHRIQEGRTIHWLGEETLTDLLIRDLRRCRLPGFSIEAFNKKKEAANGADWEWWFQGSTGKWIGMRVQAKVIHKHKDKFESLHHYHLDKDKKTRCYQSDILVSAAQASKFPCVPIYCLYSHWLDSTHTGKLPVWISHLGFHNFGCSIISATVVQHLRKITVLGKAHRCDLNDTLAYTIPLAGLVCSPFTANNSIAEHAQNVLEVSDDYLLSSPPGYVTNIVQAQNKQGSIDFGQDFNIDLPTGVIGVLVIRQT